jgi:hypothetical protein
VPKAVLWLENCPWVFAITIFIIRKGTNSLHVYILGLEVWTDIYIHALFMYFQIYDKAFPPSNSPHYTKSCEVSLSLHYAKCILHPIAALSLKRFREYKRWTEPWTGRAWSLRSQLYSDGQGSTSAVPNFFSLPYPLIRLFIYEYLLNSLPPPISQKRFFKIFLG